MRWYAILALGLLMATTSFVRAERDYFIRPVPFTQVSIRGGFWGPRLQTNRETTVWYDFRKCEETGRIDNFAVAGGLKQGGFRGIFFDDSDVFKVIEGASYCLASQADPKLDAYLDDVIAKISAAQEKDGYLYTARTINDPNYDFPGKQARWSQLSASHELYNVGHLYEAAVAHWQATGKRSLLDVAIKNADLVCSNFGRGEGQQIDVPGHEEIEMGLVKLYRATGEEKYLRQAKFFIDMRGRSDLRKTYGVYCQDHKPLVQQDEAVGHAVRAGYLYAGAADVAALTGDAEYALALDLIWENVVSKKMYLTGGVGASASGEAFGDNYALPNASAYNETCAAIAQALFNQRLFLLHGEAKYIDVLERILYNGFLSGVSLSGDQFFYPNPLACDGRTKFNHGALGRSPWFGVSCCPVNVVRFVPSIAGEIYAVRENDLYVNLFVDGEGKTSLPQSGEVELTQETSYPWDGRVTIRVAPERLGEWTMRVRIPGWARGKPIPSDLYRYTDEFPGEYSLQINGTPVAAPLDQGYAVLRRAWKPGDVVDLILPMPVRRVAAHAAVKADEGRLALERGPLVYCVEAVDHAGAVSDLYLPEDADVLAEHRPDLLGGVTVLRGEARRAVRGEDGIATSTAVPFTAIPYYAWAHREVGEMAVWLPTEETRVRLKPAPTIASASRASASHVWQNDTVEALHDQLEPASSIDHDIPRHTWWDHVGTREWVQYDFARPTTVSAVEVYWFDDTGRGRCRVPESWRLLYRSGDEWRPVENLDKYTVAKDRFNAAPFKPIETSSLRIEVQLQSDFSGGVLEWKVR